MHSEKPDLDFLDRRLGRKKALCPNCTTILIGHKPLYLEPGYCPKTFLLPEPWRAKTLALIKKYEVDLYLTGHCEWHSFMEIDGVFHNRATPARRGFEEILILRDSQTGVVKSVAATTISP